MKKTFYYLRDHHNAPRVTVCLMKDDHGIVCRGVAICSLDAKATNISRSRRANENIYTLNDAEFKAFGTTVPQPIQDRIWEACEI